MKTNIKLFFILFVSVLCVGLTACSNDDDDEKTDPAKAIVADYTGFISGVSEVPIPATIVIEYLSENKVNLKFNQVIGAFSINIACATDVTTKDNKYLLAGTTNANLPLGENGALMPLPVDIKGEVTVVAKVKTAVINITVGGEIYSFILPVVFTGTNAI